MSKAAGCVRDKAYKIVTFGKKCFYLHRLIYMYHYGSIPKGYVIDHMNQNKTDNRIENLRCVNQTKNQLNNNSNGYSKTLTGKYRVQISVNKKRTHIGYYFTECGARLACLFAKLNRTLNYG